MRAGSGPTQMELDTCRIDKAPSRPRPRRERTRGTFQGILRADTKGPLSPPPTSSILGIAASSLTAGVPVPRRSSLPTSTLLPEIRLTFLNLLASRWPRMTRNSLPSLLPSLRPSFLASSFSWAQCSLADTALDVVVDGAAADSDMFGDHYASSSGLANEPGSFAVFTASTPSHHSPSPNDSTFEPAVEEKLLQATQP